VLHRQEASRLNVPRTVNNIAIFRVQMKYLRTVKGCTRLDQIRNEDIRNDLGIPPLSQKIIEYRNKRKAHLQRMEHTRIPLQAYKYQPSGKRDIGRPRRRWRHNTRDRNRRFS
jgi:hypothetical protein